MLNCLVFKLQQDLFAINLSFTNKVILFTEMKFLPGLPDYFYGLLNLHGKNVQVIDLAKRLNLRNQTNYNINMPIIICDNGENSLGLIVDEVIGVDAAEITNLKIKKYKQKEVSTLLSGIMQTKSGEAIFLKLENLFEEVVLV